jgi:hypothetical protein
MTRKLTFSFAKTRNIAPITFCNNNLKKKSRKVIACITKKILKNEYFIAGLINMQPIHQRVATTRRNI